MLEANTDRSYFMIGAVIVAAIIIAGVIFIFKDTLFSSDMVQIDGEPVEVIQGLVPRLIDSIFGKAKGVIDSIDTGAPPAPGMIISGLRNIF